jgi:hypothetical protein
MEVLIYLVQLCFYPEIYAYTAVEDDLIIESLPDKFGRRDIEEGYNYSSEGFKRRPAMYGDVIVYEVADRLEILWSEDGWVIEVLQL